jgi:hypothetical protein
MPLCCGFLPTCISRHALYLDQRFVPFPSCNTISEYYREKLNTLESRLLGLSGVDKQIAMFTAMKEPEGTSLISLSVGAMAMTRNQHHRPGKEEDYAFVFYGQSVDRCFRY